MHVYKMVRNGVEYAPRTIAKAVSMEDGTSLDVAMSKSQTPYAGVTTNVGNAYSIASPIISELKESMAVRVKINNDSTGASTLNWYGKGAKGIKKANGSDVTNLKAGGIYTLVYGGVNFILQGEGASGNATASDLLSGKTATTDAGEITGTMPTKTAQTYTPSQSTQTIPSGRYLSGTQTISAVPVDASKVLTGTTIAGKAGTMPNRGAVASTLTTQGGVYTIPAGYHGGTGKVTASFANLVAGNVKSGVNVGGIIGSLQPKFYATGTATANSSQVSYLRADSPSGLNLYPLIVSYDFGFTPLYVFIFTVDGTGEKELTTLYCDASRTFKDGIGTNPLIKYATLVSVAPGNSIRLTSDGGKAYINSSGFNLPVSIDNHTKQWLAIG